MPRPTIFIGSSTENLQLAYAVQENLEEVAQPIVWKQGIFTLSTSILESLLDALDEMEFALFVFAPDDLTTSRGVQQQTVRDNVIFELGLFIARLGRERCYLMMPRGVADLRLPSDLLGVTPVTFVPPEKDGHHWLLAALGPACNKIGAAIREQGPLRPAPAAEQSDTAEQVLAMELPEAERKHLLNLAKGKTVGYTGRGSLRAELRHLRSAGLVRSRSGKTVGEITTGKVVDLADYIELTDLGIQRVERLQHDARTRVPREEARD